MSGIVLMYASGGGVGHRTAARALAQTFEQRGVEQVWVEDALDHGSALYRQLYTMFYLELSENAPTLWEYAYAMADNNDTRFVNDLRILLDRLGITELVRFVQSCQPEVIVCTHFLPLHILGHSKQKGKLHAPIYAVVTDYTGHLYWIYPGITGYFVGSDETREMLIERGAPESLVSVTGIPIAPDLAIPKDKATCRQNLNIVREPVVTLIGSGISVERVRHIVVGLLQKQMRGTLFVVAGRNKELQQALQELRGNTELDMHILGFIDYLDDLITASDLVVTKAGGLTISEVMARQIPMIVIDPVPGHEEWNADYVVSVGAGVHMRVVDMVPSAVINLIEDKDRLRLMQQQAAKAARPNAAADVAAAVLGKA
jgi:processive 1,2-diacylglycerol beta-glucosyltransferase